MRTLLAGKSGKKLGAEKEVGVRSMHARASACWRRMTTQGSRPNCSLPMGREGR